MNKYILTEEELLSLLEDKAILDGTFDIQIEDAAKQELNNYEKVYPYFKDNSFSSFNSSSCQHCSNNPANGGSGICHCILGSQVIY